MHIIKKIMLLQSSVLLFVSCSSVTLKNQTENADNTRKINVVRIVAENEKIIHNGQKIGTLVLREDFNATAGNIHLKIDQFARSHGANFVEISAIGWGKKGHAFYAEGSLYFVEGKIQETTRESCDIAVFRDGLESWAGSAFTIDAGINGTDFGQLKKNNCVKSEMKNCNGKAFLSINKEVQQIDLKGKSRYFRIGKQVEAAMGYGIGMLFNIGGISLTEIDDELIGKLMMYQEQD